MIKGCSVPCSQWHWGEQFSLEKATLDSADQSNGTLGEVSSVSGVATLFSYRWSSDTAESEEALSVFP